METMFGSESAFNPAVLLAMWSAGIAGAGALVAYWRIVGPGYLWLTAGTIGLVGGTAWFFDPGPVVALAWLVVIGAVPVARRSGIAAVMFGVAAVLFPRRSRGRRPAGTCGHGEPGAGRDHR